MKMGESQETHCTYTSSSRYARRGFEFQASAKKEDTHFRKQEKKREEKMKDASRRDGEREKKSVEKRRKRDKTSFRWALVVQNAST